MATATRRSLTRRVRAGSGCPGYASDFRLTRGRCLRPRCGSRWGVTRITIDYTSAARAETWAHVECAQCGRTWHRTRVPAIGQYQSTRLTLILPSEQRRWYARGRWHTEGETAITIREATQADMLAARADWQRRSESYGKAQARVKAKKAAAAAEAHRETAALLARLAERDAARQAEEAEAAARE